MLGLPVIIYRDARIVSALVTFLENVVSRPDPSCLLNDQSTPSNSRNSRSTHSLNGGPQQSYMLRFYLSISEYIKELVGIQSIPSPVIIPWCRPWRLRAPEFDDDGSSPPSLLEVSSPSSSPPSIIFLTFGEYVSRVLGIHHLSATVHVAWSLKTPIDAIVTSILPLWCIGLLTQLLSCLLGVSV